VFCLPCFDCIPNGDTLQDGIQGEYNVTVSAAKRDDWLRMRVNPEEKEEWAMHAEDEGLSLSSWIRTHLRAVMKNKGPLKPVKKHHVEKKTGGKKTGGRERE
jgi:antitoxin component of RelBE/YafQ-DinJ toxin-antitoxin module